MDLKPDNVVVDVDPKCHPLRLLIIVFDVSVIVDDEHTRSRASWEPQAGSLQRSERGMDHINVVQSDPCRSRRADK
jgi:hypothetical protein